MRRARAKGPRLGFSSPATAPRSRVVRQHPKMEKAGSQIFPGKEPVMGHGRDATERQTRVLTSEVYLLVKHRTAATERVMLRAQLRLACRGLKAVPGS